MGDVAMVSFRLHQYLFIQLIQLLAQQKKFEMDFDEFYKKMLAPILFEMDSPEHLTASQNSLVGMLILNYETDEARRNNAYRFLVCADQETQQYAFYSLVQQFEEDSSVFDLPENEIELPVLTEAVLEQMTDLKVFYNAWKENTRKTYEASFKTFGLDSSQKYDDYQLKEMYQEIYSKNKGNPVVLDELEYAYQRIKLSAQRNEIKPIFEYPESDKYLSAYTKIIQAEIDRLDHVWMYGGPEKAARLSKALNNLQQKESTLDHFQQHDQTIKAILSQHRLSFWNHQPTHAIKTVAAKEKRLCGIPVA